MEGTGLGDIYILARNIEEGDKRKRRVELGGKRKLKKDDIYKDGGIGEKEGGGHLEGKKRKRKGGRRVRREEMDWRGR